MASVDPNWDRCAPPGGKTGAPPRGSGRGSVGGEVAILPLYLIGPGPGEYTTKVPSRASTSLYTHTRRTPPGDRLKLPRGRQPPVWTGHLPACPQSRPITCLLPPTSCTRAAPPAGKPERTRPSADDAATALRSRRRSPVDRLRCLVEADAAAPTGKP